MPMAPGTPASAASRGRPRSPLVDRAILRAALELFKEHGVDGVGFEQVAEMAGVARTTVYRRWSSRESLIAEAIANGRGADDEDVMRKPLSPLSTARGVIDALAEIVSSADYQTTVARLVGSTPDHPRLMAAYWHTYLVPRRKAGVEAIETARARGLVRREADAELLLDLIGGAIMYRLLVHPRGKTQIRIRPYLQKVMRELGLTA